MDIQNAVALVALASAVESKQETAAKGAVPENYLANLSLTARLEGTIKRGSATTAKPTCSLLNKAVIGELLRRLGITRDAALRHLRDIATEAIAAGEVSVAKAFTDVNPELLLAVKQLEDEVIAKLPRQPRDGRLTASVAYELRHVKVEPAGFVKVETP